MVPPIYIHTYICTYIYTTYINTFHGSIGVSQRQEDVD